MNIEFKKIKETRFFEGATAQGTIFLYSYVSEDKLKLYAPSGSDIAIDDAIPGDNENIVQPTMITLCCTLNMDGEKLDLLGKSKIVYVIGKTYSKEEGTSKVMCYPMTGFSYEKLENVISDLCEKFNL